MGIRACCFIVFIGSFVLLLYVILIAGLSNFVADNYTHNVCDLLYCN